MFYLPTCLTSLLACKVTCSITDDILWKNLQDTTGFFIDQLRNLRFRGGFDAIEIGRGRGKGLLLKRDGEKVEGKHVAEDEKGRSSGLAGGKEKVIVETTTIDGGNTSLGI